MPHPKLTVASLHYYPVKSCAGIDITSARLDARGIKDDRGWLVVLEENNRFVTQRQIPKMALIKATINGADGARSLHLSAEGMPPIAVSEFTSVGVGTGLTERKVTVWNDEGLGAVDQGDEAAEWLKEFLNADVRLVRMSDDAVRNVSAELATAPPSQVGFQDGYPILIISQASLDDLNRRLSEPLPMNRFRPNVVIQGAEPFAEDKWERFKIGDVLFETDKTCARCVITTIDQNTGHKNVEPLKTLATFRKVNNEVMFGQNVIHLNPGTISVNDEVEVVSVRG